MFITIGNIAQHVSDTGGEALLAMPHARQATAMEAAECVNRLVMLGNAGMHAANEEFNTTFGKK